MFAERIKKELKTVLSKLQIPISEEEIMLEHPAEMEHGDYSTNFALAKFVQFKVKSSKFKVAGSLPNSPRELAEKVVDKWREDNLPEFVEKVEVEGPGFINIWLKFESLGSHLVDLLNKDFTYEGFGLARHASQPRLPKTASPLAEQSEAARGTGGQVAGVAGRGVEGKKTMVIDYSAPNIAKPFGIGHLRSTNIGQALYNLYQFLGWRAIGDNHLGDWGTQFGKLIYKIKEKVALSPLPSSTILYHPLMEKMTIGDLEKLYVEFHKEAEAKPEIEEEARIWFKKLEDGDPEAKIIWQACVDISLKEFERIYQLLGVKIDYAYGESFYLDKMGDVLKDCEQKGLLKESEGAKVIEIPAEKVPAMLIKSDGATTYLLRDLATIKFRMEKWEPDLIIYEVGADQTFYFRQLFKICVLLGYGQMKQFVHVPHGLIRWKSGKFSTRKGMTIHLEEVLNEAIERAEKLCETAGVAKDLSSEERVRVAKAIGIGAIKYNDLKQNPTTDIIFDWDQMLTLSGNSGPYLQYTFARTQSVLGKVQRFRGSEVQSKFAPLHPCTLAPHEFRTLGKNTSEVCEALLGWWRNQASPRRSPFGHLQGGCQEKCETRAPEEMMILRTVYRFPEEVEKAAKTFSPNLLCNFLFDLAQKFNLFYDKHRILRKQQSIKATEQQSRDSMEPTEEQSQFRLLLTASVGQVLKNGLALLGIEALEKM